MLVARQLQVNIPIVWIQSGLHQTPDKLREGIQQEIDNIHTADNILLLFGSCGNCLYGLKSEQARLIFPRVDDCISLFLGGNHRKKELENSGHAYYITKGYLDNEANIWQEYLYSVAKYGEERAHKLMEIILHNYNKLRIIETGAYDLEAFVQETKLIAEKLELEQEVVSGTNLLINKALQGKWDDDFIILQPGEAVGYSHLGLS